MASRELYYPRTSNEGLQRPFRAAKGGPPIEFIFSEHLPPDEAGLQLGADAATAIPWFRYLNQDPIAEAVIVEAGIGPGTQIYGLLREHASLSDRYPQKWLQGPIKIIGFDNEESAVDQAQVNLARWQSEETFPPFSFEVFYGDWRNERTYDKILELAPDGATEVIANPGFYPTEEGLAQIQRGYEGLPHDVLYGGRDGLQGFVDFIPHMPRILTRRPGAGLMFRYGKTYDSVPFDPLPDEYFSTINPAGDKRLYQLHPSDGYEERELTRVIHTHFDRAGLRHSLRFLHGIRGIPRLSSFVSQLQRPYDPEDISTHQLLDSMMGDAKELMRTDVA